MILTVTIGGHQFPAWPLRDGRALVDLRLACRLADEREFLPVVLHDFLHLPAELVIEADESEPKGFVIWPPLPPPKGLLCTKVLLLP